MNKSLTVLLSVAMLTCGARTLTGPGDAIISSNEPLSLVDDPLILGGSAVTYYDGCLATTDVTVFRNVRLSDVTNVSALAGSAWHTGARGRWLPTTMCFFTRKSDGSVECELQAQGANNLFGCHLQLEQKDADVVARITRAGHASGNRGVGVVHFYDDGAANTVVDDELETKSGVSKVVFKNVACLLKDDIVSSPNRIVFDNACTENTNCPMASVLSGAFTNWNWTLMWENADLSTATAFSAKIGGERVGNRWRTALPCHIVVNDDGTVKVRFNYGTEPTVSFRLLLEQRGADVWGKITHAVYAYTERKDPEYDFDGSDGWGADLKVVDTESSPIAPSGSIADIGCTWTRPSIWEEELAVDGYASTEWKVLLDDAELMDVSFVSGRLAGSQLGGVDRAATLVNVVTNLDGAVDWQCQYSLNQGADGTKLVGVALRSEQDGLGIRYRSWAHGYGWDRPIGTPVSSLAEVPLAETSAGTGVALHDLVFSRVRKNLLPITLGEFECGDRPIKLRNVELRVDSPASSPAVFAGAVYGTGRIVVSGNAKVMEDANFVVPVALGAQAFLHVGIRNGVLAPLSVTSFSAEDNATIVVHADQDPRLDAPVSWTLLPATAVGSVGTLNVKLEGAELARYRAALSVGLDGSIILTMRPIPGLIILLK